MEVLAVTVFFSLLLALLATLAFAWDHPSVASSPPELARELNHARCFSEVMNGAAILYNLYLAEMDPRREEIVEGCTGLLDEWLALIGSLNLT